jgi:hypothetical protein
MERILVAPISFRVQISYKSTALESIFAMSACRINLRTAAKNQQAVAARLRA